MQLHPYQQDLVDKLPKKHLIFFETGVGKTLPALQLLGAHAVPSVLIVVPKTIYRKWCDIVAEHWYTSQIETNVITKEQFKAQAKTLKPYSAVLVDECFVAGTKIKTPDGYKNIEDIKIDDSVVNAFGIDHVRAVGNKKTDTLYKITLSNNQIVKVTGNHPFFTVDGWMQAKDLSINSELLHYSTIQDIVNEYENNTMLNVQKRLCPKKKREYVLFSELRSELQSFTEPRSCQEILNENESKQSNDKTIGCFENESNIESAGTQTKNSWGEWPTNANTTKGIACSARGRVVCGTCCNNKKNDGLTIQLQNRHSESKDKSCDRGGWLKPLDHRKTSTGQKERVSTRTIRVESIEILKSTSNEGFTVYNLEVKKHPSYIVGEVLVHNCHYFSGLKSQLTKSLYGYYKKHNTQIRLHLTATPYMSTALNVYTHARLLGYDISYPHFMETFFYRIPMGPRLIWKEKKTPKEAEKLKAILNRIGTTFSMEEAAKLEGITMPKQEHVRIRVKMTLDQEQAITNLNEPTFIQEWTKKHQIENGVLYESALENMSARNTTLLDHEKIREIEKIAADKKHVGIVVFCRYTAQIESYAKHFQAPMITGKTSQTERYDIVKLCNNKDESARPPILFVQSEISAGYELPFYNTMIFASLDFKYVNYEQAQGRIQRRNNIKENTYYYLTVDNGVDEDVYDAIMNKQDFIILQKN